MERDGLSYKQAHEKLLEVRREAEQIVETGSLEDIEDLLAGELGLELDYIFDIL